jgi:transposase
MRGDDPRHESMFSYVTPEARVRADHPLRPIRRMTDAALARLSPRFERLYSTMGRPSIPPEQLLRALLLQMLYSIRSERLLVEELDYSVLYRWFVGLSLDDPIWDATTFTKNRQSEEFQTQGLGPDAAGGPEESVGEFPRTDPAQRHASVDDRSRRAPV